MRYHTLLFIHFNFSLTYLSAKVGIALHSSQYTSFFSSSHPSQLQRSRHWGWNFHALFFHSSCHSLSTPLVPFFSFLFVFCPAFGRVLGVLETLLMLWTEILCQQSAAVSEWYELRGKVQADKKNCMSTNVIKMWKITDGILHITFVSIYFTSLGQYMDKDPWSSHVLLHESIARD